MQLKSYILNLITSFVHIPIFKGACMSFDMTLPVQQSGHFISKVCLVPWALCETAVTTPTLPVREESIA